MSEQAEASAATGEASATDDDEFGAFDDAIAGDVRDPYPEFARTRRWDRDITDNNAATVFVDSRSCRFRDGVAGHSHSGACAKGISAYLKPSR